MNVRMKKIIVTVILSLTLIASSILYTPITTEVQAVTNNTVSKIKVNKIKSNKLTLAKGKSKTFTVKIKKNSKWKNATKKDYTIKSSKKASVRVAITKKGKIKITAKKVTKKPVTITVKSKQNKKKYKFKVTVTNNTNNNQSNNTTPSDPTTDTKPPVHTHTWKMTHENKTITQGNFVQREVVRYEYMEVTRTYMSSYPYLELTNWQYNDRLEFDKYHYVDDIGLWKIGWANRPTILDTHPEWEHYTSANSTTGIIAAENIPVVVYSMYPQKVRTTTYCKCDCGETNENTKTSYTGTPTKGAETLEIPHLPYLECLKKYFPNSGNISKIESDYDKYGKPTCSCDWCTTYQ